MSELERERERAYEHLLAARVHPVQIFRLDSVDGTRWLSVGGWRVFRAWLSPHTEHGVTTMIVNCEWRTAEMVQAGISENVIKALTGEREKPAPDWRALVDAIRGFGEHGEPRLTRLGERLFCGMGPEYEIHKEEAEAMGLALLAYARSR